MINKQQNILTHITKYIFFTWKEFLQLGQKKNNNYAIEIQVLQALHKIEIPASNF